MGSRFSHGKRPRACSRGLAWALVWGLLWGCRRGAGEPEGEVAEDRGWSQQGRSQEQGRRDGGVWVALRRGCFQAEQRREGLGRGVRLEAGPSHRFSEPQEALGPLRQGPGNGEGRAELYQGPLCAQVGQGAKGAGGPSLRKDSATRGSLEARLSAQRLR